jgi:fumarate reductase subunit D
MASKGLWNADAIDKALRNAVVVLVLAYVLFFGSVFEATYPTRLVELYAYPWWRLLVVLLVGLGAWWCPRVGLAIGFAAFFYLNDIHTLTTPFINHTKQ